MPELDAAVLDQVYGIFMQRQTPLIEMSAPYSIEELIRAFTRQREEFMALVGEFDDEQLNFSPAPNEFSLSEVVSHLVASQNGTYNALLELSHRVIQQLDHSAPVAGAGARKQLTAQAAKQLLTEATEEFADLIRQAARIEHPEVIEYPMFGKMTFRSWILFQIWHDLDHLRQAKAIQQNEGFPNRNDKVLIK